MTKILRSNERAKKRYREDAEYRKRAKERGRKFYRNKVKEMSRNFKPLVNIEDIKNLGKRRDLALRDGTCVVELTFTIDEISKVFNSSRGTFKRWIRNKKFPPPHYYSLEDRRIFFYTLKEVLFAVKVLGKHFEENAFYRIEHTHVTKQLFTEYSKIRMNQFYGEGYEKRKA